MHRFFPGRRWKLLLLSVALAILGFARTSGVAFANDSNCPHGNSSYYSAVCFYGSVQYDDYTYFNNNYLWESSSEVSGGYKLNNSIWAYSGSPCTDYAAEGLTYGYSGSAWYGVFAQYYDPTDGLNSDWFGSASQDGSSHSYELNYAGSNKYQIKYDGTTKWTTGAGMGSGTCTAEAGVVDTNTSHGPNGNYSAGTFDDYPLSWFDSSWGFHGQWGTGSWWIDYPCGTTPYCFNAAQYSSTHWAANKP